MYRKKQIELRHVKHKWKLLVSWELYEIMPAQSKLNLVAEVCGPFLYLLQYNIVIVNASC
jgi:hypothetical protein